MLHSNQEKPVIDIYREHQRQLIDVVYLEFFADCVFSNGSGNICKLPLRLWRPRPLSHGGVGPVDQELLDAGLLLVERDQSVVDLLVDGGSPVD